MKISFGISVFFVTLLILTTTGCNTNGGDSAKTTEPTAIIGPKQPEPNEPSTESDPSGKNSDVDSARDAKKIPEIQLVMHGVNSGFDTELAALLKGKIKTVVKTKDNLELGKKVVFLAFSSSTRVDITMQIEKEYIDAIKSSGATPVLLWVVNQTQLAFARTIKEDEMPIFYLFAKPDFSAVKKANLHHASVIGENEDEISELVDLIEEEIKRDASGFDLVSLDSVNP